ncbi:MAG: extracellular solute-binding protein [Anaerolineae bacterium]
MLNRIISRRGLLKLAGAGAAAGVLAACQPQVVEKIVKETVEVEKIVKETVEVEKVVEQTVVVEKVVGEPVTIDIWGWTGLTWDAVWAAFTEQNPMVKVNLTDIGENVFGDQKFMTAVAAGKGPSVAVQNKHTFSQFAAKGMYMDIGAYFDADGLQADDYFKMQLNEVTWGGKIYGLPRWGAVRYLHWNRKHFEEAGLDPDVPPTTWAELEEFAEKLNVKSSDGEYERYGFIPYLVGNSWMWLYGGLNGAKALSDDKRTVLCDDQKWIDALDWMIKFYDNYVGSFELANSFSDGISSAGLGDPFNAGKISMSADGDWAVETRLRKPDLDWNVAPMPIPEGGQSYSWSCGYCWVIPPSAKYPDAAWQAVKWLTGIPGWKAMADASVEDVARTWEREQIEGDPYYWPQDPDYIPAYDMVTTDYIAKMPDHLQEVWSVGQDMLMNHSTGCGTDLMGLAALEYWTEMDNAVRSALSHKMTAEEAMLDCKTKVQQATDRAWEAVETQTT